MNTNYYEDIARKIKVRENVDVLVVGSGPAGVSAAISAARSGARTMLVEQAGSVGGVATIGLMSHWTGETQGGIYEEILERSCECTENIDRKRVINPEILKTVLLEMLYEARVILQLYTFASDAIVEDGKLKGIIIESKSGREAIFAKVVIDASGDGDIAARAGASYVKGRDGDEKMQPMTLMFKVAGVDLKRAVLPAGFEQSFEVEKGDLQTLGRLHLNAPAGHVLLYRSTLPGIVTCNMTNCIDVDGTKAEDLTKAEYICRKQMNEIAAFLQEFVPGFEECYIISSASLIGVRETRHFKGEYTLTEDDILNARLFDDWAVVKARFSFDVHSLSGAGLDKNGVQKDFPQNKGYSIPYRCLVPEEIDGLLLAGRNISGTHIAHSNYRAMPICANMGQAAGLAASLCARNAIEPRMLNVKALQEELRAVGVCPEA